MVSKQEAIDSPFGYRSTALEVIEGIDLTGKDIIITGGYSGIGRETICALVHAGGRVIVGARRMDIAEENLADVDGAISILQLDLGLPNSVDAFADAVNSRLDKLDILINNAAVMALPELSVDERGYERQFAINHLGHFQLTARLWDLLVKADGARVVALSSSAHSMNGLDLDDIHFTSRRYGRWIAYAQSKSANALFVLSLDKMGEPHNIRAFAVHPGTISTPLQRHFTMAEQIQMGWIDKDGNIAETFKSLEEGAATTVWCATTPMLDGMGGVYCADVNIANAVGAHIRDEKLADALWQKSEELIGITFSAD